MNPDEKITFLGMFNGEDYGDEYVIGGYPKKYKVNTTEYDNLDDRVLSLEWSVENMNDAISSIKSEIGRITVSDQTNIQTTLCNYLNLADSNLEYAFTGFLRKLVNEHKIQPVLHPGVVSVIDANCNHKFDAHGNKITSIENTLSQVLGLMKTITRKYESEIEELNSKLDQLELRLADLES